MPLGDGRIHLGYQDHYVVDGGRARVLQQPLMVGSSLHGLAGVAAVWSAPGWCPPARRRRGSPRRVIGPQSAIETGPSVSVPLRAD